MRDTGPKTVLVVDDEALFLKTIAEGFATYADRVNVLTAPNGRVAAEILERCAVDLVVTDLKMPERDGYDLIAHMSRTCPDVPVIVMSAFGTPEIEERLEQHGVSYYLDKPLNFQSLCDKVFEALAASASGHLQGITLPTFLQMVEADRKTCTLRVRSGAGTGLLHFRKGELQDAEAGGLTADAAALEIVCWDRAEIEIVGGRAKAAKRVEMSLAQLLLEGFRRKDEKERSRKQEGGARRAQARAELAQARSGPLTESTQQEAMTMAATDKLKEFAALEGFAGVSIFTPTGEALASLAGDGTHLKEVGVLANNVLLNAQKASIEMGTGRGQQVHVEAEKAHIFARCLNEGTDPLKSQPGKAHIHLVLVLKNDASIGLAKMRMNSVIEKLAEEFRM